MENKPKQLNEPSNWQKHIRKQAEKGRKRKFWFVTDRELNAIEMLLIEMRNGGV